MDRTTLARRETSRIGFGCGRLAGAMEKKASIRLIEQVRALGISHFDVAPAYGFGLAEDVLGEALVGDAAATITTKVGAERPRYGRLKLTARSLLRPLAPTGATFRRTVSEAVARVSRRSFMPDLVEASAAQSLRRLKRDAVDALLLHEPRADDVTPALVATMEKFVTEGRAGAVGTGISADLGQLAPFGTIRQYRWSPESAPQEGHRDIVHSVLRGYPRPKSTSGEWKEQMRALGFDPTDPASWPGLLLTCALGTMPNAIVLVSSTSASRISGAIGAINWPAARGERSDVLAGARALLTNTAA